MPKVSVIIQTYNVEPYLVECMESITRQTLKDIEIICINDGSTDGSLKILQEYAAKDDRIKIVDKENGGYGIGMNIGLDMATGEYIGILEPDDYVAITMYEDLYKVAKDSDLDFVKADFYRFQRGETGNMYLVYNHLSKNLEDYNKLFNPSETPEALLYIMNTWSGIYKRDFIEKYGIRHNETPGASFQDNGFWFQTFVYGKRAMIIDTPYYRNRRDNPNSSVKNPEKVYCMNVEYDHIRDILMKDEEIWERFKYMYSVKKLHNYFATIRRISDEFKEEYIGRISEEFKRAQVKGELKEEVFDEKLWKQLQLLMASPKKFYHEFVIEPQIRANANPDEDMRRELDDIKNSTTYKVGKALMYLPCHVKELIKRGK